MAMARTAWKYFENNTQPTGLANAVDHYPSTTLWDTASYLAATVAARELGLVAAQEADARMAKLFAALGGLAFFRDELPNKVYHTQTLEKVDYANRPGEIGFSALDLGRLLVWLKIAKERYPQHADAIDRFVLRWKSRRRGPQRHDVRRHPRQGAQDCSTCRRAGSATRKYAARGFELWGVSTELAARSEPFATRHLLRGGSYDAPRPAQVPPAQLRRLRELRARTASSSTGTCTGEREAGGRPPHAPVDGRASRIACTRRRRTASVPPAS
jgi:hypothetical protein